MSWVCGTAATSALNPQTDFRRPDAVSYTFLNQPQQAAYFRAFAGDISQIDLPRNIKSGLKDAREKLRNVEGLYFHTFTSEDVVRHPLVQKIVEAYEAAEEQAEKKNGE